jgi:hypothetical protein
MGLLKRRESTRTDEKDREPDGWLTVMPGEIYVTGARKGRGFE